MSIASQKKLDKELVKALEQDNLSLAESFLKAGANSNYHQIGLFTTDRSPASIAIKKDHIAMLQLLMAYDLDQNQMTAFKSTMDVPIILFAALHNSKKTLKFLAEDIKTDFNIHIIGSDPFIQIDMANKNQLLEFSTFRTATLNIIKNAVPVRAQKERVLKQKKIRKSKFEF